MQGDGHGYDIANIANIGNPLSRSRCPDGLGFRMLAMLAMLAMLRTRIEGALERPFKGEIAGTDAEFLGHQRRERLAAKG